MATIGGKAVTLLDWAKRKDPDGKIPKIVEMLSQKNEMLDDMLFMEGNLETGHKTTIRTGLPEVTWRKINKGVQPSKSTTAQVTEACGLLEAHSQVDEALAELEPDIAAFRLSEAGAFLEAMNQECQGTVIYGNAKIADEEFSGFAERYSTIVGAENGKNIIDAGGTGSDNTSIYFVGWGDMTCAGIFPKGTKAGLEHKDLGPQLIQALDGSKYMALMDQWKWRVGLCLKDWRAVVRIANIDVSELSVDVSTGADLDELMERAIHTVPNTAIAKYCFYMNRTVFFYLNQQRKKRQNITLNYKEVDGKIMYDFIGFPIRVVDQILNTEAQVV